jgi:hypothetical protein
MCYSVRNKPDPIAPKSVSAFYGAAKIDKIFENQMILAESSLRSIREAI